MRNPYFLLCHTFGCSSVVLAAITILAPSAAALKAIAFPIPREPPVINNVFPFKDISAHLKLEVIRVSRGLNLYKSVHYYFLFWICFDFIPSLSPRPLVLVLK